MAYTFGRLEVTLVCAEGLKDVDRFGKQDPYALVCLAGEKRRSLTHTDGGKNPQWNQVFRFDNICEKEDLVIEVYDENVILKDKKIGTCRMSLRVVVEDGHQEAEIPVITSHGSLAGCVKVRLEFTTNAARQPGHSTRDQAPAGFHQTPTKPVYTPMDQTVYFSAPTHTKPSLFSKPPPLVVQQPAQPAYAAQPSIKQPAQPAYGNSYGNSYGYNDANDLQQPQGGGRTGGSFYQ